MKISVITVNLNNLPGLRLTMDSVAGQTHDELEYIVVDGGSGDGSAELLRERAAEVDWWVSESDGGIYAAMNKGTRHATGDYVCFMNSGDRFHGEGALREAALQLDGEDILFAQVCDAATGRRYGGVPAGTEVTLLTLKREILCHQGTLYKRGLLLRHPYDESMRIAADWKVNLQAVVLDDCRVKVTDTVLADYDRTGVSSSGDPLLAEERARAEREALPPRVLADYGGMYLPSELPLVSLLPRLRQTAGTQRLVYRLARLLLKLRG